MATRIGPSFGSGRTCCCIVTLFNLLLLWWYVDHQSVRTSSHYPRSALMQSGDMSSSNHHPNQQVLSHSAEEVTPIPLPRTSRVDDVPTQRRRSRSSVVATSTSSISRLDHHVPVHLLAGYTMNGTVPILHHFDKSSMNNNKRSTVFTKAHLNGLFSRLESDRHNIQTEKDKLINRLAFSKNANSILFRNELAMIEAIMDHRATIQDQSCLVFGSSLPIFEVALISIASARDVTTVDYQLSKILESRFTFRSVEEFWKSSSQNQYNVVLSYSTIQHDGLGRFGDALDADGDLHFMDEVWSLLKPGGIFLMSVPLGNDCVAFNVFRVYGRRRLPHLLTGWSVLRVYGIARDEEHVWYDSRCNGGDESGQIVTFVLRKERLQSFQHGKQQKSVIEKEFDKVPGLIGGLPHYQQ
eukprot:PhM_4_TR16100/c0_g1_i1/m.28503